MEAVYCMECGKLAPLSYHENRVYGVKCECGHSIRFSDVSQAAAAERYDLMAKEHRYDSLAEIAVDMMEDFYMQLDMSDKHATALFAPYPNKLKALGIEVGEGE